MAIAIGFMILCVCLFLPFLGFAIWSLHAGDVMRAQAATNAPADAVNAHADPTPAAADAA